MYIFHWNKGFFPWICFSFFDFGYFFAISLAFKTSFKSEIKWIMGKYVGVETDAFHLHRNPLNTSLRIQKIDLKQIGYSLGWNWCFPCCYFYILKRKWVVQRSTIHTLPHSSIHFNAKVPFVWICDIKQMK